MKKLIKWLKRLPFRIKYARLIAHVLRDVDMSRQLQRTLEWEGRLGNKESAGAARAIKEILDIVDQHTKEKHNES